jgi:hypothetical protein
MDENERNRAGSPYSSACHIGHNGNNELVYAGVCFYFVLVQQAQEGRPEAIQRNAFPGNPAGRFGGMAKKRISQETFDAAVKENIEDFGLSPEEATRDTIKEFELQASDHV